MATLTTKYSVGDVVYHASTTTERKRHPCPDCQGSNKWKATSPAGGEYEFACPRCGNGYHSDTNLNLEYTVFAPLVRKLTIGSVQFNTHGGSYDSGAGYMCLETGVGSGSVYGEDSLFSTEEEATIAARALAAAQDTSVEWVATQFNKSLRVCDYQLDDATLKLAKEAKSRASSMLWNLGDLFERIDKSKNMDEVREAVDDYKQYDWERDKEKAKAA